MSETIYYEDGEGLQVSSHYLQDGQHITRVTEIADFELVEAKQTGSVQLRLLSSLGKKDVWLPVARDQRANILKLRSLVLGLSRAIADLQPKVTDGPQVPPTTLPVSWSTPSGEKITLLEFPAPLERLATTASWLMREPDEPSEETDRRFAEAVSADVTRTVLGKNASNITTKAIYEYRRKYGHRHFKSTFFKEPKSITIGELFRPLPAGEFSTFVEFMWLLFRECD